MLDRVAKYINKVMLPVSRICSSIGMVTTVLLVLVIVVGVCSRRFFNMPIRDFVTLPHSAFPSWYFSQWPGVPSQMGIYQWML